MIKHFFSKILYYFKKVLLNPLFNYSGYNFVNTLFISGFVFLLYFLAYNVLKKKIKIDKHFLQTTLLFTLLGAFLRILEEEYIVFGGVIKRSLNPLKLGFYFHTPGLLILITFIYLLFFLISYKIYKENYHTLLKKIGLCFVIASGLIVLFNIRNWGLFFLTIFVIFILYLLFLFLFKNIINNKHYYENKLLLLSQTLDASATLIGLYFFKNTLYEEHFFSRFVISICPLLFIILKIGLVIGFIYFLDNYYNPLKEKEEKIRYIKQIIIILGLLTGVRNLLTIWLIV